MHPKISVKYAADFLGASTQEIKTRLQQLSPDEYNPALNYFGHQAARAIFNFHVTPKIISFQIVKGGTGKTSLACGFAIRASLFGFKVLCIDLDQQANLTHAFKVNAVNHPVMIDILAEGYSFASSIVNVHAGIDLLPSRFENALLDEVIKLKKQSLANIYRVPLNKLTAQYDVIVIDCPPNLGQSVAAATLASNLIVAPVIADSFALSGLEIITNVLQELCITYNRRIPLSVVLNKYDIKTNIAKEAFDFLRKHKIYSKYIMNHVVRLSQEFPNTVFEGKSIFDSIKPSIAKEDIDALTRKILNLAPIGKLANKKTKFKVVASMQSKEELI